MGSISRKTSGDAIGIVADDQGHSGGRVLHAERDIGKLRIMQSDIDTMAKYVIGSVSSRLD